MLLLLLGLLAAWTAASLLWAGSRSDAWEETNRTLFYLVAVALVVVFVRLVGPRSWVWLIVGLIAVITVTAFLVLLRLGLASDPTVYFASGRLNYPITYWNGLAAFLVMGFWLALGAANAGGRLVWAQALLLALATLFLELALLPQSRAALWSLALVLPFFVVLSPHRFRALTNLAVVSLPVVLFWPALNRVYVATRDARLPEVAIASAMRAMTVSVIIVMVLYALTRGVEWLILRPRRKPGQTVDESAGAAGRREWPGPRAWTKVHDSHCGGAGGHHLHSVGSGASSTRAETGRPCGFCESSLDAVLIRQGHWQDQLHSFRPGQSQPAGLHMEGRARGVSRESIARHRRPELRGLLLSTPLQHVAGDAAAQSAASAPCRIGDSRSSAVARLRDLGAGARGYLALSNSKENGPSPDGGRRHGRTRMVHPFICRLAVAADGGITSCHVVVWRRRGRWFGKARPGEHASLRTRRLAMKRAAGCGSGDRSSARAAFRSVPLPLLRATNAAATTAVTDPTKAISITRTAAWQNPLSPEPLVTRAQAYTAAAKTAAGVAQDRARMLGLAAGAWQEAERRDPRSWPIVYESALALLRYRDAVQKYSLTLPPAWLGPGNQLAGLSVDQMTTLAGGYVDKLKILDPLGKEAAKIEVALPLRPAGD